MKKVGVLLMVLTCFMLCGCTKKEENNKLVLVTEAGFAPYEYYEGSNVVGVDISIGEEIAKYMGKELVVKDVAFDSIISELNSGKADFAAAGMSITEERKQYVDFSKEYVTSKQVILSKKATFTKDMLTNAKIAVQLGSVADFYVQDNLPNSTLVQQKKYLSALEDLKNDKVDCIIMDELPAKELVKQNENIFINDEVFTDTYGMAVKKGNTELVEAINHVLDELIKDGKINEYILRYSK